jgi:GntR family transcriptional regulator
MVIDKGDGARGSGAGASPASGVTGASAASGGRLYSDQHLRVSDAEREAVCDRLAGHFAAGRLDQAEFDDRVARAMSAKTRADLRGLFADLSETGAPAGPELARGRGGPPGDGPPGGGPRGPRSPGDGPRGPGSPIEFRLDAASGVPTYLQLVHQVEHALRLGYLTLGDQLPKVRDVVASLAINPNTVLKAYKELETKGLTTGRPGQGTFIRATLSQVALPELAGLRKALLGWLTAADGAGLDEDGMVALFTSALRDFHERRSGSRTRSGAASGETEGVA